MLPICSISSDTGIVEFPTFGVDGNLVSGQLNRYSTIRECLDAFDSLSNVNATVASNHAEYCEHKGKALYV